MGGIIIKPGEAKRAEGVLEEIEEFRRHGPTRGRDLRPLAKKLGMTPFKKAGGDPKYEREGLKARVTIPDHSRPLKTRTYYSVLDQLEEAAMEILDKSKPGGRA